MNTNSKIRLIEVMRMAKKLDWYYKENMLVDYPVMQLSEVEKCMLAMIDDFYFERMKNWTSEVGSKK